MKKFSAFSKGDLACPTYLAALQNGKNLTSHSVT